jgi:hypothetical protein
MQSLNELAKKIHSNAKAKGFYDDENEDGFLQHQLFEIKKELGEASEAHKKQKLADVQAFQDSINQYFGEDKIGFEDKISAGAWNERFEHFVKDTFEDELCDVKVRILDFAGHQKLDLDCSISIYDSFKMKSKYSVSKYLNEICKVCDLIEEQTRKADKQYEVLKGVMMVDEIAHYFKIDLDKHIELKMQYNSMRGKLHGKQY